MLQKYPTRNVLIEGHTDSTGSVANLTLSEQRADAIRDLLVARGVSADRIATRGYGMQPRWSPTTRSRGGSRTAAWRS
jgi:outer membrane protein OmpA-like peptidoglycan-associated protein